MFLDEGRTSLRDIKQYPQALLKLTDGCIQIPVTYKKTWDDGFGARGWKLDVTIDDPAIIASTRETGQRIGTSVFVHDILDHFLSGFGVSGHRSEAMALMQLAKRTGSTPESDYEQLVREDILNGYVNGESLLAFLPYELCTLLPIDRQMTDRDTMAFLKKAVGEEYLTESLVDNFFMLGKAGEKHADISWKKIGLNPDKRTEIGLALQGLLEEIDREVEEKEVEMVEGSILIEKEQVVFSVQSNDNSEPIENIQIAVS